MHDPIAALRALAPGRHYGASAAGAWVMVGRDVRDVDEWSIVPPAASLTLAWGDGGCRIRFDGGALDVRPGDCMWIDAGVAHRGRNAPGSDFLTVFLPDGAALPPRRTPVAVQPAPTGIRDALLLIGALCIGGQARRGLEAPLLGVLVAWLAEDVAPAVDDAPRDDPVRAAAMEIRDPARTRALADIARDVGLSRSELSRRFRMRYHLTPQLYRKQVRLAIATRDLRGGMPVTDAAHRAGFADAAHLSRTFKAQYGIAPARWQRDIARGA